MVVRKLERSLLRHRISLVGLSEALRRHFFAVVVVSLAAIILGPYYLGPFFAHLFLPLLRSFFVGPPSRANFLLKYDHVMIGDEIFSAISLAKSRECLSACHDFGPCPEGAEHCVVARKTSSFLNDDDLVALRLEKQRTCALASSRDYEKYRSGELENFLLQSQFPLYLEDPWAYRPRDSYIDTMVEKSVRETPLLNVTRASGGETLPRILALGLGGGGKVAHTFSQLLPYARLDVVEPDEARLEALEDWFCRPYLQWFRYIPKDPLAFLQDLPPDAKKYDLVIVDAFQGSSLPTKLTTETFFRNLKDHVNEDALVSFHVVPATLVEEKSLERKASKYFSKVEVQMFREHALLHLNA